MDELHRSQNDGTLAHSEVIVGTPDVDLVLDVGCVSDGELGGEPVDVVEVSVRPGGGSEEEVMEERIGERRSALDSEGER